jgi:hypothetical protein
MSSFAQRGTGRARRSLRGVCLATIGAAVAVASAVPAPLITSAAQGNHLVTQRTGLRAGVMPKVSARPQAAPAGAHLTYYGGKVIPNVQVIQVLYGTGTYVPEVQNTAAPSIASFYAGVTNSAYYDWLSEYNTTINAANGQPGTQQSIGRGSFVSQVQITPSAARNGATVDDTAIQAELQAQISGGHLPTPNANTLYAVYFPANKTITQGGGSSGVTFCAYHGTVASGPTPEFYYSVLPDFTTGGMTSGCGGGTRFQNETSVSSHELVEATTDAEVGLATTNAPPLAWYDSVNGEIGDICNGAQGTVTGGDGRTYTVQQEFSNRQNACIITAPAATNDFSMSLSPSSVTIARGASATSAVSTATTAGAAQTVTLSATGQPAGVTTSFNPASVTSGGSSTMTVSTSSAAAAGTYPITVKGTGTAATHTATLSVTVTVPGGGALTNGGFESGSLSSWTSTGSTAVVSTGAQAGTYAARVGSTGPSTDSSVAQTFTATATATGLSFYYNVFCPDTVTYDWATATLRDNTTGTTATPLARTCVNPSSGWKQVTSAITANHSYTLTLSSHDDNYSGDPTYTLFDSVALTTGGGGGGTGITNGGFETGTLSGWTAGGAHAVISSTTPHSGTRDALGGNTTATNGDSTFAQTFTAPAGTSHLGLWYSSSCPDTVTYDWVTATLRDNTAGTTATILGKTCAATTAWTAAGGSVVPGHSYTLTLTSHDDNYASDPTYTLFDDITVT